MSPRLWSLLMFDRRKNEDEPLIGGRRMTDPESADPVAADRMDAADVRADDSERAAKLLAVAAKNRVDNISVIVRNLRSIIGIMFIMMLIAIIVSIGAVVVADQAVDAANESSANVEKIETITTELRRSEVTSCIRAQVQRERANVGNARQYLILLGADSRKGEQKKLFDAAIRSAAYSPPVDCRKAKGGGLVPKPEAISYDKLGPMYALKVLEAAVDPVRPQPLPRCYVKQEPC